MDRKSLRRAGIAWDSESEAMIPVEEVEALYPTQQGLGEETDRQIQDRLMSGGETETWIEPKRQTVGICGNFRYT